MRKLMTIFSIILLSAVLVACSEDEVLPEDRLEEYVNLWNEQDFTAMYDMHTDEAKDAYPTEEAVDRFKKIYEDMEVSDLAVSFEVPEEKEKEDEEATSKAFPIQVKMETFAGPITFDYQVTMVQQEVGEEEIDWFVDWNPGFIFPELKDGGQITFEFEDPARGQIFDRNHFGLAVNEVIYNMGVVPERFENREQEVEKIAEALEMSVDSINQALNADWVEPSHFVPLKIVPTTEESVINELMSASGALTYQTTTGRIYPYGEATAHLIGYTGKITAEELEEVDEERYSASDVIGKRGLEQLFEDRLKGEKGVKVFVTQEGKDNVLLAEKPVKHGETINLTIDAELQEDIYELYDGDAGTTAAIHPKTGETLALVSSPAFDPNQLAYGISQSAWDELQEDPREPLINRFAATYAPGSVIKPISGSIGMNQGVLDPNEGITIEGPTWGKESWGNYQVRRVSESNGPVDLHDALVRSDNIYFAQKAVEMGSESFIEGLNLFGFNEDFPFTYPITKSSISTSGDLDREILLADTSYGQGELEMSSLHLAISYTPFLNEGNMLKPLLETSEETAQVWQENIISPEQAQIIKDALRDIVAAPNGTARGANVSDANLSGKTGTAELKSSLDEEDGQENGWFVVYPENEDILLAMMIEHIEDNGGSGYVVDKAIEFFDE